MSTKDDNIRMVVPTLAELPNYVRNSLETVAKNEAFTEFEFEIEPGANLGDGFVGIMLRVTIKGTRNGMKEQKLNVLCKIPPMHKMRREQFNSAEIFSREILMYNDVIPFLKKYQESKGMKENEGFFNFPKCYSAGLDEASGDAVVIMEDLREKGYSMADKFVSIDFPHAKLVMEGLGRLHALSFALKVQEPEKLKSFMFKDLLTEMMNRPEFTQMFQNYFDQCIQALQPDETSLQEKLTKFKDNFIDELTFFTNAEEAEPYAVLNHVRGFDENNGRVIVKLALGQKPIMLGEKFVQLVTAEEYQKYSKIPVETEHEKKHNGKYGLIASRDSKEADNRVSCDKTTSKYRRQSPSNDRPSSSRHKSEKYSSRRDRSRDRNHSSKIKERKYSRSDSNSDKDTRKKSSKSKKKSSRDYDRSRDRYSSDEDRREKKHSKKNKRERSRSRSR